VTGNLTAPLTTSPSDSIASATNDSKASIYKGTLVNPLRGGRKFGIEPARLVPRIAH
jgi:hypothetical protein